MCRYAVEFIGTFFLVLTIGCTGLAAAPGVIAPLAIGGVLMAMIYAGGHISGAHYNPAVTLGVFLRGRCPASDVLPYWGAQLLGAAGAALIVGLALRGAPVTPFVAPVFGAFLAEFLFTFALVYVVSCGRTGCSNRIFKSFDEIVDHCCYAWNTLIDQPWKIMSIARRDWAVASHSL